MQQVNFMGMALGLTLATLASSASASIVTTNPLAPVEWKYQTPSEDHAKFGVFSLQLVGSQIVTTIGADEMTQFDSEATGTIRVFKNGQYVGLTGVSGAGSVTTMVYNKAGNVTGTFETEMLSMHFTSGSVFGPLMIRESSSQRSMGQTSIKDIGGGFYQIDSFFNVFTEISVDGGLTWESDRTHVDLSPNPVLPAPGAAALLGLAGLAARRRRGA